MLKTLLSKVGTGSLVIVGLFAILFQRGFGPKPTDVLVGLLAPETAHADVAEVASCAENGTACGDQSNDCCGCAGGGADASCL